MPIHDYHCHHCGHDFEQLVRSTTVPACPQCGSTTTLQRQLSRIAPAGTAAGLIAGARRAAAREGHFSHYSKAERAKLGK
jgi:putative FmdB family regulatory protein